MDPKGHRPETDFVRVVEVRADWGESTRREQPGRVDPATGRTCPIHVGQAVGKEMSGLQRPAGRKELMQHGSGEGWARALRTTVRACNFDKIHLSLTTPAPVLRSEQAAHQEAKDISRQRSRSHFQRFRHVHAFWTHAD